MNSLRRSLRPKSGGHDLATLFWAIIIVLLMMFLMVTFLPRDAEARSDSSVCAEVIAYNEFGQSNPSELACSIPQEIIITNKIEIKWNPSAGAAGYIVRYRDSEGTIFKEEDVGDKTSHILSSCQVYCPNPPDNTVVNIN